MTTATLELFKRDEAKSDAIQSGDAYKDAELSAAQIDVASFVTGLVAGSAMRHQQEKFLPYGEFLTGQKLNGRDYTAAKEIGLLTGYETRETLGIMEFGYRSGFDLPLENFEAYMPAPPEGTIKPRGDYL
jgi:hypothetical protein